MDKKIPLWIMAWCIVQALVPIGFSITGYINPGYFGEHLAGQGPSIYAGEFGLYVARNVGTSLIAVFAITQRSAAMLILFLLLRVVTDIFDTIHKVVSGTLDAEHIVFATLWIVGSSFVILKLWPIYKSER